MRPVELTNELREAGRVYAYTAWEARYIGGSKRDCILLEQGKTPGGWKGCRCFINSSEVREWCGWDNKIEQS